MAAMHQAANSSPEGMSMPSGRPSDSPIMRSRMAIRKSPDSTPPARYNPSKSRRSSDRARAMLFSPGASSRRRPGDAT